jgi:hypothetical protein
MPQSFLLQRFGTNRPIQPSEELLFGLGGPLFVAQQFVEISTERLGLAVLGIGLNARCPPSMKDGALSFRSLPTP